MLFYTFEGQIHWSIFLFKYVFILWKIYKLYISSLINIFLTFWSWKFTDFIFIPSQYIASIGVYFIVFFWTDFFSIIIVGIFFINGWRLIQNIIYNIL